MKHAVVLLLAALSLLSACSPQVRGGMALSRGDYPGAEAAYRQALAENPDNDFALRKLGQTLVRAGDYVQAEAVFRQALGRLPGDWFSTFYLGLALIGQGQRDRGFEVLSGYARLFSMEENRLVAEAVARTRGKTALSAVEIIGAMEQALEKAQDAQVQYDHDNDFGSRSDVRYLTPQ